MRSIQERVDRLNYSNEHLFLTLMHVSFMQPNKL